MNKFFSALLTAVKKAVYFFTDLSEQQAIEHLTSVAILFGKAFGPDNIKHFSELTAAEQADWIARVPVLGTKHKDWPDGLNWIPRTVTTFIPQPGFEIKALFGNTRDLKPIPDPGCYWGSRGWLTYTSLSRVHVSFGFRPDDVDGYINFPRIALKKV